MNFTDLSELEDFVQEWRQDLAIFFHKDSHPCMTLLEMCDLTDSLHDLLKLLAQRGVVDQWMFLHELRELFVHQCHQLNVTHKEFGDFKSFEAQLSNAVRTISVNMFC